MKELHLEIHLKLCKFKDIHYKFKKEKIDIFRDLSRNRIRKIDSLNFASQSKLEALSLNRNLIDSLEPGAFHGVNNLQILNLSSNRLQFISEGLFGLTNLSKL